MYIYMYVYTHTYIYMYAYTHIHIQMYMTRVLESSKNSILTYVVNTWHDAVTCATMAWPCV